MKPLRIIQHLTREPPGYLHTYLTRRNMPFEIFCLDKGERIPRCLDDVAGLIFMGGAGSVNDDKPWIAQELTMIREADSRELPVMGICFGAQLMSKALGGKVFPSNALEVGWHNITSINSSIDETWLAGLPSKLEVFQWHAHTFTAPPGAISLWSNNCNQQQGFIKQNMLAMQFHLEMTHDLVETLSRQYAGDISQPTNCVQTMDQISINLSNRLDNLHRIADKIYDRWLNHAGLAF